MEAIEFYLWEKQVCYRVDGNERVFTQQDREIVEFVLDFIRKFFPDALMALSEACSDSAANKRFFDFRRVDRFIRCNFSEHDKLNFDVYCGLMHFEDVRCPLRGMCKHEEDHRPGAVRLQGPQHPLRRLEGEGKLGSRLCCSNN